MPNAPTAGHAGSTGERAPSAGRAQRFDVAEAGVMQLGIVHPAVVLVEQVGWVGEWADR
jgi:hypothetical protein